MATIELHWTTGSIQVAEQQSATLDFIVRGTDDLGDAWDTLLDQSDALYENLPRTGVNIVRRINDNNWEGQVTYGSSTANPLVGDSSFSFDIRTEQARVTQSYYGTTRYPAAGTTAPDFQGGIGFNGETFEGADVPVPVYSFSETHYIPAAFVTAGYKATVFEIAANPVNLDTFRGFSPGEVLFLGCSGSLRDAQTWELTYGFQAAPNLSGLSIGTISGISKQGWDYLWVLYDHTDDAAAMYFVKQPLAAYVERVLGRSQFSRLGI